MEKQRPSILLAFFVEACCLAVTLIVGACVFDTSGLPVAPDGYYTCASQLKREKRTNIPFSNTVTRLSVSPNETYSEIKGFLQDKSQVYKPYRDIMNWAVVNTNYPNLKGANLIRTNFADRGITGPDQLRITWQGDSDQLYVCYDSRATRKPDWLTNNFTQVKDQTKNSSFYVTISMPDKSKTPPAPKVEMEVWEYGKKSLKANDSVTLQGNVSGFAQWPSTFPSGEKAMYFVLVRPKVNVTSGDLILLNLAVGCYPYDTDAVTAADAECESKRKTLGIGYDVATCGKAACTKLKNCPDPSNTSSLTMNRSFPHRSEIEFITAQSSAKVEVMGETYTRPVNGHFHFEYLDLNAAMQINSMVVTLDDFSVDHVGDFEDISVVLYDTTTALCKDTFLKTPCDHYRIAKDTFVCGESAKVNGDVLLFITRNANPLDITIDQVQKTFHLKGGPLTGTIDVDGDPTTVKIEIDLLGSFLNFAPKAVGTESDRFSQCSENRNQKALNLYASGSYDIYDSIPANQYEWYEDFGLVTEKLWGTGPQVTIPQGQLSFGIHSITLMVKDNHGIVDADTIEINVDDTIPPSLTIPPDQYRYVLSTVPLPIYVNIGQAGANDGCSDFVAVSNDAPDNLLFDEGIHYVTWEADDGRGNVTTGDQKVVVAVVHLPTVCDVADLGVELKDSTAVAKAAINACRGMIPCPVDLALLISSLNDLISAMDGIWPEKGGLNSEIISRLQEVQADLSQANVFLSLYNQAEDGNQETLESAIVELESAMASTTAFVEELSPWVVSHDGIWKDAPLNSSGKMNFYVQSYSTGSDLIIASPDGQRAYAFLDADSSDGFDADDLGGMGCHLSATFTSGDAGSAMLTMPDSATASYDLYRWYPASTADRFSGIYKDAPVGQQATAEDSASTNFFVQTYETSMVVIATSDARSFHIFLNPIKRQRAGVYALAGGSYLSGVLGSHGASARIIDPDGREQNFDLEQWYSTATSSYISGAVSAETGAPLPSVTMDFGDLGTVTTDTNGGYRIETSACTGWSGTATPAMEGYFFTPPSRSYADVTSNWTGENYIAYTSQPETVTVSGTVSGPADTPLAGVTVEFSQFGSTSTDTSGRYAMELPSGWTGTVTPLMEGHSFEPPVRSYENLTEIRTNQDFQAAGVQPHEPVIITGTVRLSGDPLGGVTIQFAGQGSATTGVGGEYAMEVPYEWSGSATPMSGEYSFEPTFRIYDNLTVNQTSQDFEAFGGPEPPG
ncbi:MAG: carboxypeptidase regulatory-like domain-containing protein, partial [Deltaproteobacteria bacterium]|nr:carboxypeptidase regulatory-like domain-containing protein [Deltaproteobacteria bacterium]